MRPLSLLTAGALLLAGFTAATVATVAAPASAAPPGVNPVGCGFGTGGPYADTICWIDMASYSDATASQPGGQAMTVELTPGYTLSFTIHHTDGPDGTRRINARQIPTYSGTPIGRDAYVSTPGRPALYESFGTSGGYNTVMTMDNIVVTGPLGPVTSGFGMVMADAETTNQGEGYTFASDKPVRKLAEVTPAGYQPACGGGFTGAGTTSVTCLGTGTTPNGDILTWAEAPSVISASFLDETAAGQQGMMFGLLVSGLQLTKVVDGRAKPSDSFTINVADDAGNPYAQKSTGISNTASTGIMPVRATMAGSVFSLSESADAGTDYGRYRQRWACSTDGVNTPITPSADGSQVQVTVQLGTIVDCTVTNSALSPSLRIDKSASPSTGSTVAQGGRIDYTVTAENTGDTDLTNGRVHDDLSDVLNNATYVPGSAAATSGSVAVDPATGSLDWTGDLATRGRATITYSVTVADDAIGGTRLENHVTGTAETVATPGHPSFPVPSNCTTGTESGCMTEHTVPNASLTIAKDDGVSVVRPGDDTTYTITVTNPSTTVNAPGTGVTDALPAALTFQSATDGGTYDAATRTVTWDLGLVRPGEQRQVSVTATVAADLGPDVDIRNVATLTGPGVCDTGCEAIDENTTPPQVTIAKSNGADMVEIGGTTTYELTVANKSAKTDATDVVVTDTLPEQLTFQTATDGGTYDADTRVVTWNLGTLPAGSSRTVAVIAQISDTTPAGETIVNTGQVSTGEGCVVAAECESTDVDHTPDVTITKDDHHAAITPGSAATYDLTVTNNTPWDTAGVVVTDELPEQLTFDDASDGGVYDADTRVVTWELGTLSGHEVRTVQVAVTVSSSADAGTQIRNVGTVTTEAGCTTDCTAVDRDDVIPGTPNIVPAALAFTGAEGIIGGSLAALLLLAAGIFLNRRHTRKQ